jgi:hypothetical protein
LFYELLVCFPRHFQELFSPFNCEWNGAHPPDHIVSILIKDRCFLSKVLTKL